MELIHIILFFDKHVSGINIIVGKMIFSILVSLDFVHGLFRMCLTLPPIGIGPVLPRRPQILIG